MGFGGRTSAYTLAWLRKGGSTDKCTSVCESTEPPTLPGKRASHLRIVPSIFYYLGFKHDRRIPGRRTPGAPRSTGLQCE
ncbi:uncharacterized protein CANTADRAFT_26066 [Suhomyces tanzawaensis NRRL Y-17324]|uniref:Uncharacterized protein n=1 Tax=Suhomyces tanzawaensis NRRL Y-17324 TaxID=984487 RepID=A0A1E4SHS0_9ASCO|nr:uncharacterized protein CANTADRAFT_26066 [Suhomyces tanzawaensis NRRL Y-17324]ODV78972.1 hypothetical protein CANTADRAFT_26066 [Suhomyces tanzawaensis NRRL Y-17324]